MATPCTKEDEEQHLSDKIAKLTIKVEDSECNNELDGSVVDDIETCKTPTAIEYRIPEPSTCPPAPRKRKGPFSDADKNGDKRIVMEKEIETIFSPDHDSSKT
ncbi:hypothetical protein PTKIN_Ptkin12aG0154400 [Pterospermum kingtungense]